MAAIMGQKQHIRFLQFTLFFILSVIHSGHGQGSPKRKTHDMIYYDILSYAPCVRRFNATHQVGCTSEFSGNNGVIHFIQEVADLDWLLKNGTYSPYIALMTPTMFNLDNINKMLQSNKVNGILVDHSNISAVIEEEIYFSPDKSCPNDNFGMYSESSQYSHCSRVEWNSVGNGMSTMDLGIPVFAMTNPEEVKFLIECYMKHNRRDSMGRAQPFPQCAGEMYNFMFGAKDTPTCVWRTQRMTNLESSQYCDPMGDFNVMATLLPTNKSTPLPDKSLIVAAAQLDATGLFYSVQPSSGAENVVSGFVTLLAAAQVIGSLNQSVKDNMTNIMFTFFQGESYDYIGSSRMVYDMAQGQYPLKMKDDKQQPSTVNLTTIAAFLEVRQLALASRNMYYAHIDPLSQSDPDTQIKTSEIVQHLKDSSADTNITIGDPPVDQPLPPASFQQFLRNESTIPGVVITDHSAEYENKYYNSRLDLPEVFGVNYTEYNDTDELPMIPVADSLTDVATTLARTLYLLARPSATDADTLHADAQLVNDLLFCFNQKPNCSRLREVTSKDNAKLLSNNAYNLYVGVYKQTPNPNTHLVGQLLGYYLGEHIPMSEDDSKDLCKGEGDDQIFDYDFVQGFNSSDTHGVCVKSTRHTTIAVSPAFDADNPDWGSTKYSTWTESQWGKFFVRAFLKPSRSQETVTFSVGMIVIIIAFPFTYFLSKKSEDLFP